MSVFTITTVYIVLREVENTHWEIFCLEGSLQLTVMMLACYKINTPSVLNNLSSCNQTGMSSLAIFEKNKNNSIMDGNKIKNIII